MRAFVAIDLPPLGEPTPAGLRPEDHLTLHFFEELPLDRIPAAVEAIGEAARECEPFEVVFQGVGAFPGPARPRVVWTGVTEGAATVRALADRLRVALSSRAFPTERRPFVPHRTLARIRSSRDAEWAARFLADPENRLRTWTRSRVSEVLLKQSELTPEGARHTVRERVPLGNLPRPSTP